MLSNLLKRRVLAALVLVFAILGGTAIYVQAGKVTTTYRTAPVAYGTITQTIGMAGNLAPVTEADLNFAAAGTVQSVTATVGETVVKGETLAAQDSTLLAAQLSQAKATLASAKAKLSQDQAGPTAQILAQAENPVAQAQVSVNSATTSLADTKAINAQAVAAAQGVVDQNPEWELEFWNRSIVRVESLDSTLDGPGPSGTRVMAVAINAGSGQAADIARPLAEGILWPVVVLGSGLLYFDQAARLESGPRPRRSRDADLHHAHEPDRPGRPDPEGEPRPATGGQP